MFGRPTGTATTTVGGDRDAMRCWWLCRRAGVRGGALDDWLAGWWKEQEVSLQPGVGQSLKRGAHYTI